MIVDAYIIYNCVYYLVPESCMEASEALQHFTGRFEQRYGAMHPLFYVGGLKDAVREATSATAGNVSGWIW